MYDSLSMQELYDLAHQTAAESRATHARMMDGLNPRIPVFGDEWEQLSARCDELNERFESIYGEIDRREMEARPYA